MMVIIILVETNVLESRLILRNIAGLVVRGNILALIANGKKKGTKIMLHLIIK